MQFPQRLAVLFVLVMVPCWMGMQPQPAEPEAEVVARVGEQGVITLEDVQSYADRNYLYQRYRNTSAAHGHALEGLVAEQLKLVDFFAAGLHEDEALRQRIERTITEELVLAYFEEQYKDRYINEEAVREAHEQMGRRVVYQQITLPKSADASPAELVESLRERWASGEDAEVLAGPFSKAAAYGAAYGYGEPVGWQQSLTSRRNRVVFGLEPGDVRAFETSGGYQIVRVERQEAVPVEPLEKVREQIVATLRTRYLPGAMEAFEREKQEAVDTSAVRWNPEGLQQLVAWSHTPYFYSQGYRETLPQAIKVGTNPVIMTYPGRHVDVAALLDLLNDVLILRHVQPLDVEVLKDFVLEAERTRVLAERARSLGLEEELLQPYTTSTMLQRRLARLYDQRVIEERLPEPTDGMLRAFYEEQRDSLFYQQGAVNAYVLVRPEQEAVEALWSRYEQGVPFEELTGRWVVRTFVRGRDGIIILSSGEAASKLSELAFEMEEGAVQGPIAYDDPEAGRQYAIMKVSNRREDRPLRYEEVEGTIAETFRDYHRTRLEAAVVQALRARYPVTIYQDALAW